MTFPFELGESGELRSSMVLALIANMRESVVLDFEEWCSNGVFNIKRSEPRTSLQLIIAKYDSLFLLNLYLEVRRQPENGWFQSVPTYHKLEQIQNDISQNEDIQIYMSQFEYIQNHIVHLVHTDMSNEFMVVWCNLTDASCNSTVFREQRIIIHRSKLEGFCHNFVSNYFTVSMCNK